MPRGSDFEFVNEIFGGSIPRNFIPAVEKGIQEARQKGVLAGYPTVDFRVILYDGSYHDVDSSEMAFKSPLAGLQERYPGSQTDSARTGYERGSSRTGRIRRRPHGRFKQPARRVQGRRRNSQSATINLAANSQLRAQLVSWFRR